MRKRALSTIAMKTEIAPMYCSVQDSVTRLMLESIAAYDSGDFLHCVVCISLERQGSGRPFFVALTKPNIV
jgi:hypothetical protein